MKLKNPICNLLDQLVFVLKELTNEQYVQPVHLLSGSSIGQHIRHILEFYIELNKGYYSLMIDYDQRVRNRDIECNKQVAILVIGQISEWIDKPDRMLTLNMNICENDNDTMLISTNYCRELVYNMEHTVHHMALIRIGIGLISAIILPVEFGVAASTIKYRNTCVQ